MGCFVDILLEGVPVSSTRGALGWCSVILLVVDGKKVLFDTGSYGDRKLLLEQLRRRGLGPGDIDVVFLSHFHFDHVVNFELFGKSEIVISKREFEYVSSGEYNRRADPYVPLLHIGLLEGRAGLVEEGDEVVRGVRVVMLPGHTPGLAGLYIEEKGLVLTGDAVKNAWEFGKNKVPTLFFSEEAATESYKKLRSIAEVVVPGHDIPFKIGKGGELSYLNSRDRVELQLYLLGREEVRRDLFSL